MASLITELRQKIRALAEDFAKKGIETFEYSSGDTSFTLQEDNPINITSVTKNGDALGSGDYSYNSDTNELTILVSLNSGDIIVIKYDYYKYSNSEIDEYIRGSLAWISIYSHCNSDFEFENEDVYPTPSSREEDLISIVATILLKPNYSEYKLPNLTVKYPRTMDKETKMHKIIERFYLGLGINDVLEFTNE